MMPVVDITIGPIKEHKKRSLAKNISKSLTDIGVKEEDITIIYRHVTGEDVAKGGGYFPYWKEKTNDLGE